ncbi:hypothetical protein SFC76_03120 [Sphingomonas sp. CD22]|uniref:hypothetical protein n=1 Tax=Sphingomonas sp. CD22 TaxID=3100214 RepID=UPI002ADF6303|nr:hypothetical protein [Sphingomonas sp. CD22]MEA1083240.1 hypothetical protein [Sphingomonas sp. CD22]
MADAVHQQQDTKLFAGGFLVWKLNSKGFAHKVAGKQLPWKRHPTMQEAIAEAQRLNALHPASTFVVIQEVARVKMVDAAELAA